MHLFKMVVVVVGMMSLLGCATIVIDERTPEAKGKVAVCHKGKKAMYIDESAVKAHLGHGDYLGVCK